MFDEDWGVTSVARHKKDEVDKLAEIAAPRERIVLGALVLFILAATAAASLGTVGRSLSLGGELSQYGTGGSWHASLLAPPEIARQFEVGKAARIEVVTPSGAVIVLPGEIVVPTFRPSSKEPAADMRRIFIAADVGSVAADLPDLFMSDGIPCRINLPLGRQSILRALILT